MSSKYSHIILISSEWNEYHRKEFTEELYKQLSSWSSVFIIQLPVSLLVHLFSNFKSKILGLLSGKFKPIKLQNNVVLFTPVILFHYLLWLKFKPFAILDSYLLSYQINKFIKKQCGKIDYKLLWVYFPQLFPLTRIFKNNFLIYDYYDNFDYDYNGNIKKPDSVYNEKLISKSSIVICTAQKLYERAIRINKNSLYLPNGNSYYKILKATSTEPPFNKKRKIVGYIGAYRDWSDFSLVESMVKKLQEVDFVFVGAIHHSAEISYKALLKNENFYHIPPQPFEKAAEFLKIFDVGIIPFRINRFTEGVFPNKFFEYMAAGIPIVSTALMDLRKYSNIIGYSKNNMEFISNLRKALNGVFNGEIEKYKDLALKNSWKEKAKYFNQYILETIHTRISN